jgi:hypothetical protein
MLMPNLPSWFRGSTPRRVYSPGFHRAEAGGPFLIVLGCGFGLDGAERFRVKAAVRDTQRTMTEESTTPDLAELFRRGTEERADD